MGAEKKPLIFVLVLVIVVSIIQFRFIDDRANNRYSALNRYDTDNLVEIGYHDSPHFRQAYGLHLALSEVAYGSDIVLPTSGRFSESGFRTQLLGFGKVASLQYIDYDDDVYSIFSESTVRDVTSKSNSNIVNLASDVGGDRGEPWHIIADKHSQEDRKRFIVLRWHESEVHDYTILLVETSLLPGDFREDLGL
jgi:hypothetical protein